MTSPGPLLIAGVTGHAPTRALLAFMLVCACGVAQAQSLEGRYARVQTDEGSFVRGSIEAETDSTIVLVRGDRRIAVVRADIRLLEIEAGREQGKAVLAGAQFGGLLGMVIGLASAPDCSSEWMCFEPWGSMVRYGGIGMLAGAIGGAALAPRRWRAVPLENVRVSILPVHGANVGPVVSLRF